MKSANPCFSFNVTLSSVLSSALLLGNTSSSTNLLVWHFEPGGSAEIGKRVPDLPCSGNCSVLSTEFARAGKSSLKTVVDRINSETMYRTEVQQRISLDANHGNETIDYWFGFSLYVPSPYPVLHDPTYEIFFQVHSKPPRGVSWYDYPRLSPPLETNLRPSSSGGGAIWVRVRGLDTPYPQEVDPRRAVVNRNIATYKTDKWINCVIHTRYDSVSAGFTEIWVDGVLALDYQGSNYYRGHGAPYPKFGLYNGWRTRHLPNEPVTKRTVFHDEYRIAWGDAGSFSAVSPGGNEEVKATAAPVWRKDEQIHHGFDRSAVSDERPGP